MYLHYDDEPAPRRSAAVEIWRDCARRAARYVAFYALLAVMVLALGGLGCLDSVVTFTWGLAGSGR